MIVLLLALLSVLINILIVHILTKKVGFFNPVGGFIGLIPFFGTLVLFIILLIEWLEDLYD